MNGIDSDGNSTADNGRVLDAPTLDLEQCTNIAGRSPVFVYQRKALAERVKATRKALPSAISLHYSIKANPHASLVSYIGGLVDGMDVASHRELLLAIASGLPGEKISFSGPGKSQIELTAAVAANITIHVESLNELLTILKIADEIGQKPSIAVRINPPFNVKRSGMIMGGGAQQFGVDLEQLSPIMKCLEDNSTPCAGLHCYPGSQMLDSNVITDTYLQTLDMMESVLNDYSLNNVSLNIGGGLGVPYFAGEREVDIKAIGIALESKLEKLKLSNTVIIELGRYLVAGAGTYVAQVVDKKVSRGKTFLILNGGLNHHLAATGNLGQVLHRNFPITTSSRSKKTETVSVVGPLCTPLDTLATDLTLSETQVGDYIAIHQSGAYGHSASPQGFLSHLPSAEILID